MSEKSISRQSAIDLLKPFRNCMVDQHGCPISDVVYALDKAIEVLGQEEQKWIPCSERMPEDLEEVNITWVNHDPEPYYNFVKDKPFTATAVYYKEKWYWYSSTCADYLAEYGQNRYEEIDDGIEIIAWMPMPKPWKGEDDE